MGKSLLRVLIYIVLPIVLIAAIVWSGAITNVYFAFDRPAGLGTLAPQLTPFLLAQGKHLTAAVYVLETNHYYIADEDDQRTVMASTAKVPILLDLLHTTEVQGRSLTDQEVALSTAMIEESDNDAALTLYDELGDQDGVNHYLHSIGVVGITMNAEFGYSTTTPLAMVKLLTKLQQGSILKSASRTFALQLLLHIDPAQQFGIGTTAPPNSTYAMKDGWVVAPDNTWTTGSVGIVATATTTYIIAVYAQGHVSEDSGFAAVDTVCSAVAQKLATHTA